MNWNGGLGRTLRIGVGLLLAAVAFWQFQSRQAAETRREKLNVVATVTAASLVCRDDRKPFEVTIRNLTGRIVLEASFTMHEMFAPPGMLPSDSPTVSLTAPLRPGDVHRDCYALNYYRLIARGVDPRRVQFTPMLSHIEFQ